MLGTHLWGWASDLIASIQSGHSFPSVGDPTRIATAFVASALELNVVSGLIVPGDAVMLWSAATAHSGVAAVLVGAALALGGWCGAVTGFLLGHAMHRRHGGAPPRRLVRLQTAVDRQLRARGGSWVFVSRFLPIFRTVTPFLAGYAGFGWRRFMLASLAACTLWPAVFVGAFWWAGASLRDPGRASPLDVVAIGIAATLVVGSSVASALIRRALTPASQEQEVAR